MTRNEAYLVFRELNLADTFVDGFFEKEMTLYDAMKKDECICDEIINYFESLDIPFDVLCSFVNGWINFTTTKGNPTEDDWDYVVIYKDGNKIGMYVWTEVLGIIYDIANYGKTWKARNLGN